MEEQVLDIERAPLFILKAGIVREIITDTYTLARCIENELRKTPQGKRKTKKEEYNNLITRCDLRGSNGINILIKLEYGGKIYNSLYFTIDSNDDYSIRIGSSGLDNLILLRTKISEFLIDLSNDTNYLYDNYQYPETHAILIDESSILSGIYSSKYTNAKYNKLKYEKVSGYKFDCDVFVYPRLKAVYVENGMEVFGGIR
jgi:hypothetical protein